MQDSPLDSARGEAVSAWEVQKFPQLAPDKRKSLLAEKPRISEWLGFEETLKFF